MEIIEAISNLGNKKYATAAGDPLKYLLKATMAGFFLAFATIVAYNTGAIVFQVIPEFAPLAVALTFSIGLILISFLGAELFTGNNFIMVISLLNKKVSFPQVVRVWIMCFLGNLIGSIFIIYLYILTKAQSATFIEYINAVAQTKLNIPLMQIIIRGILCNFAICIASLSFIILKSDIIKIIIICACVFIFISLKFEHSIANMSIFSLAFFLGEDFNIILAVRNIIFATFGNILGGGILLAVPYFFANYEK